MDSEFISVLLFNCHLRCLHFLRLFTNCYDPLSSYAHNHGENYAHQAYGQFLAVVRREALTDGSAPKAILGKSYEAQRFPRQYSCAASASRYLARNIQRHRSRRDLNPSPKDLMFEMPKEYTALVVYDSGPGEDRIIVFSHRDLLAQLRRLELRKKQWAHYH